MQKIMSYRVTFFCLLLLLLSGCAEDTKTNVNDAKPIPQSAPSSSNDKIITPVNRVIELYANLSADIGDFEGAWQSKCTENSVYTGYSIERRIFHLDGFFHETALFNDRRCEIKNSRNTVKIFGKITATETITLFNGDEDIEIRKITSELMTTPTIGFPIPLEQLTLGDLTFLRSSNEIADIIINRLYVATNFDNNAYPLIDENNRYLVNRAIDVVNKTEVEIDQLATNRYNPLLQ